jgi:hypothetical protein
MKPFIYTTILAVFTFNSTGLLAQYEDTIPEFNKRTEYAKKSSKKYEEESGFFKKKNVVIGTGFNLSFTNTFSSLGLSPSIGYRLLEPVEIGLGGGYNYLGNFSSINQHNFFIGPYLKVYPLKEFFISIDAIVSHLIYIQGGQSSSLGYGNVLIGGGYNTIISDRAYVSMGIKINIIRNNLFQGENLPTPFIAYYLRLSGESK